MPRATFSSVFSSLCRASAEGRHQQQQAEQQAEHVKAAATAFFLTAVAADASVGAGQVRKLVESW